MVLQWHHVKKIPFGTFIYKSTFGKCGEASNSKF